MAGRSDFLALAERVNRSAKNVVPAHPMCGSSEQSEHTADQTAQLTKLFREAERKPEHATTKPEQRVIYTNGK
jgi:prephenate dehydrogenase